MYILRRDLGSVCVYVHIIPVVPGLTGSKMSASDPVSLYLTIMI